MRAGGLLGGAERVSRFLAEHRVASFLITAVGAILLADDVRRVLSVDSQVNLFTWVALALMACAVIATGVMLKRAAERVRLLMAWGVGVSP